MSINFTQLAILENKQSLEIFKQVVKNRSIGFKELVSRANVTKENARLNLKELQAHHLIEEQVSSSDIDDYNTFYVTADGLEASRKVGI